jgi:hypothetical protein
MRCSARQVRPCIDRLGQAACFAGCSPHELRALASIGTEIEVPAGSPDLSGAAGQRVLRGPGRPRGRRTRRRHRRPRPRRVDHRRDGNAGRRRPDRDGDRRDKHDLDRHAPTRSRHASSPERRPEGLGAPLHDRRPTTGPPRHDPHRAGARIATASDNIYLSTVTCRRRNPTAATSAVSRSWITPPIEIEALGRAFLVLRRSGPEPALFRQQLDAVSAPASLSSTFYASTRRSMTRNQTQTKTVSSSTSMPCLA